MKARAIIKGGRAIFAAMCITGRRSEFMHEVSIAERILAVAEESLAAYKVVRVNELLVEVGLLANVMPEALRFAFEAASSRGVCRGAKLTLLTRPIGARCRLCGEDFATEKAPPVCPVCGGRETEITGGTEINLHSIDFEEGED